VTANLNGPISLEIEPTCYICKLCPPHGRPWEADVNQDPENVADPVKDLALRARRLLEDAKSEPIPDRIMDLAQQLDEALAKKRDEASKAAAKKST
jgi:hypothetical protein